MDMCEMCQTNKKNGTDSDVDDDIKNTLRDISKFLTIIFTVHSLFYVSGRELELFDEKSLKLMFFVAISLVIYNFLVKKITL